MDVLPRHVAAPYGRSWSNMKVSHIITGLDNGGAETMLYRLLSHTDRKAFESQVISLTDIGPVGKRIQALGVPVRALEMRRGVPNQLGVSRVARCLGSDPPDVIQTWLYQADLIGGLAARVAGNAPVVWGVHNTILDPASVTRVKMWTVRACSLASRWLPTRIVCCAESAREAHAKLGYAKEKLLVIPNGCDTTLFSPDPGTGLSVREELGVREGAPLIGLVARFDAPKDHYNFIRAAALLHGRLPDVNFVLCGDGISWENQELVGWIDAAGMRARCHLLGRRHDMPRLTAALDLASSSSFFSEAWPLVVGEAMACGVPCVVTDVGDSAVIVGETGRVVPPRDPKALADAWQDLLSVGPDERARLGIAARRRIERYFSLRDTVAAYEDMYEELATTAGRAASFDAPR